MLSFWCQRDPAAVDRLFRSSGLMRAKWDSPRGGSTYGAQTIAKAVSSGASYDPTPRSTRRTQNVHHANGNPTVCSESSPAEHPTAAEPSDPEPEPDGTATGIILSYFRTTYRPLFRRGNAIVCEDGETIPMNVACQIPTSKLLKLLEGASDAPRFQGGAVKVAGLPKLFTTYARVAWGDLRESLPDEDQAALADGGAHEVAQEEFRRIVRDAMLTEVVLGEKLDRTGTTQTERRPLADWCQRFAKVGFWKDIRGKRCWSKFRLNPTGDVTLMIAIRHELFAQLRADRRLTGISANTFGRRAKKYGVGATSQAERPHGLTAVILDQAFVADLISGFGEPDDVDQPTPESAVSSD